MVAAALVKQPGSKKIFNAQQIYICELQTNRTIKNKDTYH